VADNLLDYEGRRYLVAPRGETEWVRNLRVAKAGELRLGRKTETFSATEVTERGEKVEVLRRYLQRWKMEVGVFFGGVSAKSSDDELMAILDNHPVFRLEP
jgi:hypothetical protein